MIEKEGKLYYTYEDIYDSVKKVSEEIVSKDINVDVIIAIATGGWFPARILRTLLPSGDLPLPLYSVGMINYDNKDNLLREPRLLQKLPDELDLNDKTVLVVDEVTETGGTLIKVKEYISSLNPKKIYTVVLHVKDKSKFKPDFAEKKMGNKWIVYPWEKV